MDPNRFDPTAKSGYPRSSNHLPSLSNLIPIPQDQPQSQPQRQPHQPHDLFATGAPDLRRQPSAYPQPQSHFVSHPQYFVPPPPPPPGPFDSSHLFEKCTCKSDTNRIPRPRNAFILFRQKNHQLLLEEGNVIRTNPDVSRELGRRWRNLSPEDKEVWNKKAEEEKKRHAEKYPGYKYSPRRAAKRNCPSCRAKSAFNNHNLSMQNYVAQFPSRSVPPQIQPYHMRHYTGPPVPIPASNPDFFARPSHHQFHQPHLHQMSPPMISRPASHAVQPMAVTPALRSTPPSDVASSSASEVTHRSSETSSTSSRSSGSDPHSVLPPLPKIPFSSFDQR